MRLIDADALERDIDKYCYGNDRFKHWVQVQQTIGGWTSVKDRLPPMHHMVLITGKNGVGGYFGVIKGCMTEIKGQWYRDDIGQYVDYRGDTVTHWMPLPEPPQEDKT